MGTPAQCLVCWRTMLYLSRLALLKGSMEGGKQTQQLGRLLLLVRAAASLSLLLLLLLLLSSLKLIAPMLGVLAHHALPACPPRPPC